MRTMRQCTAVRTLTETFIKVSGLMLILVKISVPPNC